MTTFKITAEVDEQWFEILGQITKHQEGFVWCGVVTSDDRVLRTDSNGNQFLGDN